MSFTNTFITKYKPYYINEFSEFSSNKELISILKILHELEDLNILLIGHPSSGKTTILYAIIREYYGLKKTDNIPETNIMFINNLKEQGINFYRNEMKTFCQSHCSIFGKKKMVVIDDMDNINEQSQQVFRNYIDKYKNNVHFVSVCTNIQKVIESIQSRVHIINILPPDKEQLRLIMEKIVKEENIDIDKEATDYLLMVSNNSIRGLINNLEKMFILNEQIDLFLCKKLCSNISFQIFESYIQYIRKGEIYNAVRVFYEIHDYGYSVIDILDYFFTFIKTTKMVNEEEKYRIIPILCKYITVFHSIHEDVIELSLLTNKVFECLFVCDHK